MSHVSLELNIHDLGIPTLGGKYQSSVLAGCLYQVCMFSYLSNATP
jgi:hypothetical protein